MEFHVHLATTVPGLAQIERQLLERDPAGLVDLRGTDLLRVSTCLDHAGLLAVLADAGHALPLQAVQQQPSVCCGGCGG
jgi:hypothetical protein